MWTPLEAADRAAIATRSGFSTKAFIVDAFAPPGELTDYEIDRSFAIPDARLEELPLISEHAEPQLTPQQYECGCIAVTRVTDRDTRFGERPFEMRLARPCGTVCCELREHAAPRGR